jgi:REP element-mobilizing transposase RayT
MTVRKSIQEYDGIYFITLTCCRWLHLFAIADAYDAVYKWFDYLKNKGHYIVGYVIMPNHLHALLAFRNTQGQSINLIVGNGKRFMAYDIISRLEVKNETHLLEQLAAFVNSTERRRGKLHEVFEPSFDWKECYSDKFIAQKLDYIHANPCVGKWNLADEPWNYSHSSATFYYKHVQGIYDLTSYTELEDIDLTKHDDVGKG